MSNVINYTRRLFFLEKISAAGLCELSASTMDVHQQPADGSHGPAALIGQPEVEDTFRTLPVVVDYIHSSLL